MTVHIGGQPVSAADHAEDAWLGDSEMAVRIRDFDWSVTPLGPRSGWPTSLRWAVAMCLHSRFQMAVYWGPDLNCIYNDAERDVLGKLHPVALAMPARELLRDSWDVVGPQLHGVMEGGKSTWAEDQPLSVDRRGALETAYFTYSYSPIRDDAGGIGGVLLVTQETTGRVLAERRLDALRELAAGSMDAESPRRACELAARSIERCAEFAFVEVYLLDGEHERAVCVAGGPSVTSRQAPQPWVDLRGRSRLASVFRDLDTGPHQSCLIDSEVAVAPDIDIPTPDCQAVAVAIRRGSGDPTDGFLVVGISDYVPFDEQCRPFAEMIGLGLGRSIAAARARQADRERASSLAALERAKSALFSNASHELRTPLALIIGPLEQVLDDPRVPSSAREQVALSRRSASRMLRIVNGLLDFSRIDAGERIGVSRPTDLAELTRDVAAMFRSTAEQAGLDLSLDCPALPRPVVVDQEAWETIVSNLLSNALKFTRAGSISVELRGEPERVSLTVRDTGIGIAAEDLERIFSRFYRVGDPRARSHEGTGLGLALVRELVRMHGGSVTAESTPDRGTAIVISVPYAHTATSEHARSKATGSSGPGVGATAELFVEEIRGWLQTDEARGAVGSEEIAEEGAVLIVEDNHDMRDYLRRLLLPSYPVQVATNGDEAYRSAIEHRPCVVISDVMMPGSDGFRLLHDLRSDPRTKHVPVILVSARADPESTLEAFRLGADDYLVKPFGARELLARTRSVLESSRLRTTEAEARGRAEERALAHDELRSLLNDLKAAQGRIAAAADAERRRIERNLHDGAQQRLMAIRLELGLLSERLATNPLARGQLDALRTELDEAVKELRELAHGLYPPVLASAGLPAALAAAARRAAIGVELETAGVARLPPAVENAVYFCCMEALQNVVKHAGEGARATIGLVVRHGALEFRVSDDGIGFDRDAVSNGHGLTNLTDRLAALGGEAVITSVPGHGTTVAGQIPLG